MYFRFLSLLAFAAVFLTACSEPPASEPSRNAVATEEAPEESPDDGPKQAAAKSGLASKPAPVAGPRIWSEVTLHEAIRSANPGYSGNGQFQIDPSGQVQAIALDNCGVTDLSPFAGMQLQALYLLGCAVPDIDALAGMPLVELYLEQTGVTDLGPLEGTITLRKLYLSDTDVSDLTPLYGLPIVEMNLVNTQVKKLDSLRGMPLQMLWLTGSPIEDVSGLSESPLVSVTLHKTNVTDLSPFSNTGLQRLHIGETPVTDLSPLAGMRLTRLVFDPEKITKGMEAVKAMPTITQIGRKFEDGNNDLAPPAVFWPSLAPPAAPGEDNAAAPPTQAPAAESETPWAEAGGGNGKAKSDESLL